jgi:hypothetical protein
MARLGYQLVYSPRAIVYHTHPDTARRYVQRKFWRGYWRAILYSRYPKRAVDDSWTPQLLKVQVGLAGLAILTVVAWPLLHAPRYLLGGLLATFGATTVPFLRRSAASGPAVVLGAPFLLFARASAIGAGFCAGITVGVRRFRRSGGRPAPLPDAQASHRPSAGAKDS